MRPISKRWYVAIPVVVVAVPAIALLACSLLGWFLEWRPARLFGTALAAIGMALAATLPPVITWCIWAVPYFAAADPDLYWPTTPRRYRSSLRVNVYAPATIVGGVGVAISLLGIVRRVAFHDLDHSVGEAIRTAVLSLAVAAPLALVGWIVDRPLRRRFAVELARRELCFGCGYNLHGVASDTCPECGLDVRAGRG